MLKQASNKTESCPIKGIDFIYVINLDQRPEKFAFVKEQFEKFGITPYRFSAVNGWELPPEIFADLGIFSTTKVKSRYQKILKSLEGTFYQPDEDGVLKEYHLHMLGADRPLLSHCMSRGAVGIVLSHLSILKDAYDSGYKRIWITEDDIEILGDINELTVLINEAQRVKKSGWDILYTDIDTKTNEGKQSSVHSVAFRPNFTSRYASKSRLVERKKLSNNITLLGTRYGAYSYIINRSGMKAILDFYNQYGIFLPYDMDLIYVPNLTQLSLRYNLVSTKINSPSDNGGPFYKNKEN